MTATSTSSGSTRSRPRARRSTNSPEEQRRELEERALVGAPENVVDQLEEYHDALGEDVHFVIRPYAPGIETEELLECIRRLGEEVAPRL